MRPPCKEPDAPADCACLARMTRLHPRARRACTVAYTVATSVLHTALLCGCVIPLSPIGVAADGGPAGEGGSAAVDAGGPDALIAYPPGSWINVTSNLANIPSTCASLTSVSSKPDEDLLIAGVAAVGIYGSRDGGSTWQELSASSGTGQIVNRMTAMVYDPQVSMRYWEVGIYGGSPFVTNDDGVTWTQLGTISHTDLLSIDFSDPARKTLLAGGHELAQTLSRSTDSGMTWTNIGGGLPMKTNCTLPLVLDAQTYLVGCGGYGGGPTGVYRTIDGGAAWKQVTSSGGGAPPLRAADGAIYWVGSNNGMTRSLDNGQTWTDVLGYGTITSSPSGPPQPVELPGNRIAVLGTNYVMVSSDQGKNWAPGSGPLPITPNELLHGLAYSSQRKAFYVWHNTCTFNGPVPVPTDAVMRFDFE
jgi:photosystem II stability/assembly factor-like uncharacterized protein